MKNIFVIGLDDFHLNLIRQVHPAGEYRFHALLDYDEAVPSGAFSFDRMLAVAESRLRAFRGPIDALIGHWDFPSSAMLPILCRRFGLRSPSPEAVLKCEHKYWSRLLQQSALPECTPRFFPLDPFDDRVLGRPPLPFPFWLKPVKSFSSHLGFRVEDEAGFRTAIEQIRERISRFGDAFNEALGHIKVPPEVAAVDGNWCVAEAIGSGLQCGVEGYTRGGQATVHGIVDCVKDAQHLSFTRYEYPSVWPDAVQRRMAAASARLMTHIGYDDGAWGVEFFWQPETDRLLLIEINPRISQSHSDQFIKVDGASNHQVLIDVALGREPSLRHGGGKYASAAKFLLRKYRETVVTRVPPPEEIAAVEAAFDDCTIRVLVEEGMPLSRLPNQDSYSFEIANIFLGAQSPQALVEKYRQLSQALHFEFADGVPVEPVQFQWVPY